MLLNKLLVGNLMIGFTVLLQGLVPMPGLSDFGSFWMFIAAIISLVLAEISFVALLFMARSHCILTMGHIKHALFHSPAAVFSLLSLIFFILYAFLSEPSTENGAVKNAILLLVVATSSLLFSSLVIVFLAFRANHEVAGADEDEN